MFSRSSTLLFQTLKDLLPLIHLYPWSKSPFGNQRQVLSTFSQHPPKPVTDRPSHHLPRVSSLTHVPKIVELQNPPKHPRKDNSDVTKASQAVFSQTQAAFQFVLQLSLYSQSQCSWLLSRTLKLQVSTLANQQPEFSCLLPISKGRISLPFFGISPPFPGLGTPLPTRTMN